MNRLQEFVRETAHEIRTPMNTVSVGFKVIKKELSESRVNSKRIQNSGVSNRAVTIAFKEDEQREDVGVELGNSVSVDSANFQSILQMVDDTKASADIAVELVSDLLLYDRLEEGALTLVKTRVKPWRIVQDTLLLFKVQVSECVYVCEHVCVG